MSRSDHHHATLLPLLQRWHQQLRQGDQRWQQACRSVEQQLPHDPIAPLRRRALQLLQQLSRTAPGSDQLQAAALIWRDWGDQVAVAFPALARHRYEQAWACHPQAPQQLGLGQRLAQLARRQGWPDGALALDPSFDTTTTAAGDPPPWYDLPCSGLGCGDCQELLQRDPLGCSQQGSLTLTELEQGRIWCDRANPWRETYAVGAATAAGDLLPEHGRCFPWSWPGCRHQAHRDALTAAQLAWQRRHLPPAQAVSGPVLAVADLSAELHYHFLLELLPRLGTAWRQLSSSEPQLQLWHNGGRSARVQEALRRLGIAEERVLHADAYPHLQAERLWLASWPAPFGAPGAWVVPWLQELYGLAPEPQRPQDLVLWLPRGDVSRRPLLQEQAWIEALTPELARRGLRLEPMVQGVEVRAQLQQISQARQLIAPHGGAMANLVAAAPGSTLLELVNPGYAPPYFATVQAAVGVARWGHAGSATADPLAQLLYSGPLEYPIDLGPPDATQRHRLMLMIDP